MRYNYLICLLDLEHNRQQRGIFLLQHHKTLPEILYTFGIPSNFKKLLSNRWELHFSEVENSDDSESYIGAFNIPGVMKKITATIEDVDKIECRTILLPANVPTARRVR